MPENFHFVLNNKALITNISCIPSLELFCSNSNETLWQSCFVLCETSSHKVPKVDLKLEAFLFPQPPKWPAPSCLSFKDSFILYFVYLCGALWACERMCPQSTGAGSPRAVLEGISHQPKPQDPNSGPLKK